ncbi:5-hydroxytryptamine receptor 3A-like [Sebastes umbrosus]|uniref:5-hydroxytryptamine receptor 3A-like n=1 Tax=Sebastes umbrosus TaxID=72105 RepID=UPI00189CB9E9|nr:5-hydroxytryptamine receptor 3A-like [Sebastes umbrosus]
MSPLRTLAFLALIGVSSSQTSDCSYVGLLTHLNLTKTNNVLSIMRPVKNWTTTTLVQLDMVLYGILQVDEKSQAVTSHIWFQTRWMDEFLTWNSSDFCGIKVLNIPRSRLWIPYIYIEEDVSDTGAIYNSPTVSLSASGVVVTHGRQRLTSTCRMNLALFPFDTQICSITFTSMTLDAGSITLGTFFNDTNLAQYSEQLMVTQGEWDLNNLEILDYSLAKGDEMYHITLTYKVTISRRPLLYVVNLIVPLFLFLILDVASFFINEARGEKLSFKVTVLLSISVLLLILKDMLPSTEDRLPMIATYCVGIFALVGVSVLEAMLVGFLFDLDDYNYFRAQSPDKAQVEIQLDADYPKDAAGAEETPEKSELPLDLPGDGNLLKLILEEVKAARQEADRQEKDKKKIGYYRRVAEYIDSSFFTIYFLIVLVFMSYMSITWITRIF